MLSSTSQSHQADEEGGVHEGRSTLRLSGLHAISPSLSSIGSLGSTGEPRFAYAFAAALAFVYCPRDAE